MDTQQYMWYAIENIVLVIFAFLALLYLPGWWRLSAIGFLLFINYKPSKR
jgi:hypothetical protein